MFQEAFAELQSPTLLTDQMSCHLVESLCFSAAKKEGTANMAAIRDLGLPNEGCKMLERMIAFVVDEVAASQFLPLQQAFISDGDIMFNVCGLHEESAAV